MREYRCAAGLSQEALAERAHLSPGAISTLERSTRRGPQHQTLSLLAEALHLAAPDRARLEAAAAAARRRPVRPGSSAPMMAAPTPVARAPAHDLPHLLTSFHGRERDLDELDGLLRTRRLIALLGVGGVGKTRLAIETARRALASGNFPGGVWFVELAPLADGALVPTAIARPLGVRERPDVPLLATLIETLAHQKILLVLDNCEHVIDACARVAEALLRACSGVTIVATTREALRIDGECVVRVEPLPYAPDGESAPAIDLLVDRLIDADFSHFSHLSSDDRAHVATICRRLDGVPLALELVAGRARDLSLAAIASGLEERFDLLADGRRTASPRQNTLRGMIDWSHALLAESERALFARLGLFADAFEPEAVAEICAGDGVANVRDALAGLIAKSLVTVVEDRDGRTRYRLLETIRAYALDRLHDGGTYDRFAHRFATYFRARACAADARYGRMPNDDFLAAIEPDLDNFRAALDWTLGCGNDAMLGAEIAGSMGFVYRQTALFGEGIRWAERALVAAPDAAPAIVGRLHMALSFFYFNLGGMQRALDAAIAATAAYRNAGDAADLAWSLAQQVYCLYRFGRLDDARDIGEEAVRLAREGGDSLRLAGALNAFALTVPPDRPADRFAALEEAIRCYRASGDVDAIVSTAHLAGAYYEAGDFAKALALGSDVVEIARRNRDRSTISSALVNVAAYALAVEDIARAESAAREALERVRDLGKTLNAMCALQHLASVAARRGEFERAGLLEGASDELYREFGLEREITERSLHERTIAEIRDACGEETLATLLARGAARPFEDAVADALTGTGSGVLMAPTSVRSR